MESKTFRFLTPPDWTTVLAKAARQHFEPGQIIVEEGTIQRHLFIVHQGYVSVERKHHDQPITIAVLGPGAVFGEMSFLEHTATTASVIAHGAVDVDLIEGAYVQALLASDAGFSARFYQSLAVILSERLRETSDTLSRYAGHAVTRLAQFHTPRAGYLTARQIPESLESTVGTVRTTLHGVEEGLRKRQIDLTQAQQQVDAACDSIVDSLGQHTTGEALVEVGFADLLSFRDTDHLEIGVGSYLFREMFPFLMSSVTMARLYAKPKGFPEDFETVQMLYSNEPQGDGILGPLMDRWFLSSSIAASRRSGCRAIADLLLPEVAHSSEPTNVVCLASGTSSELFDLLKATGGRGLRAVCVDIDADALVSAASRAEAIDCQGAFTFVQQDLIRLARGPASLALAPQKLIYGLALLEYLEDEDFVAILNWAYDHLQPGGLFAATNPTAGNPFSAVKEHLLEWTVRERTPDEFRDLFSHSRFAGNPLTIRPLPEQVEYLAVAARGSD